PLAEWSLDEVWICTPAGAEASELAHFYELEIELLAPDTDSARTLDRVAAFSDLVAQVQAKFMLTPIHTSKVVRGLEAMLLHAHNNMGALTPEMALDEACRLLLHQQLWQILLNEQGARA